MKLLYKIISVIFAAPFAVAFCILYILAAFCHFCASWIKNGDSKVAIFLLERFINHGETNIVPKTYSTPQVQTVETDSKR